jgi:hypothetical protein
MWQQKVFYAYFSASVVILNLLFQRVLFIIKRTAVKQFCFRAYLCSVLCAL